MAHAVINPNDAYHEALCLSSFDDGNTRANTLYWISTRPGFDPNYIPQTTPCTPIQITTTTVSIGELGKKTLKVWFIVKPWPQTLSPQTQKPKTKGPS